MKKNIRKKNLAYKKFVKRDLAVISIFIICSVLVGVSAAHARDLTQAASTAASSIKTVAQILAVTGVIAGGGLMQLPGLGFFGKGVLTSGLVGCLCAFAAPGFLSLMTTVFGGL